MLVAVFAACVLCTCVSFGCFALTSRKSTDIKKADKLAEFDSYVVTGKEKQYKQRVSPATSVSLSRDITVCVADARQGGREDAVDDPDTASTDVGASPVPSASSPGSRVSQMAPLASPCSVASVASQPARMSPLPSPSTLSISSITAVLQSPAHANGPSEPNDTVFLPQSSPCLGSPSRSPKRRPTLPSVSETETHSTEAVLDHPHAPEEDAQPQAPWLLWHIRPHFELRKTTGICDVVRCTLSQQPRCSLRHGQGGRRTLRDPPRSRWTCAVRKRRRHSGLHLLPNLRGLVGSAGWDSGSGLGTSSSGRHL